MDGWIHIHQGLGEGQVDRTAIINSVDRTTPSTVMATYTHTYRYIHTYSGYNLAAGAVVVYLPLITFWTPLYSTLSTPTPTPTSLHHFVARRRAVCRGVPRSTHARTHARTHLRESQEVADRYWSSRWSQILRPRDPDLRTYVVVKRQRDASAITQMMCHSECECECVCVCVRVCVCVCVSA